MNALYVHAAGAKILLSIGGAVDHIDGSFGNEDSMDMSGLIFQGDAPASLYAERAAQAVLDNDFDGLDYDLELHPGNFGAFRQGYMGAFLEATHIKTRQMLPASEGYIVSHAPMGPYASVWAGEDKGYVGFMLKYQHEIDFISLQYYNQGFYTNYAKTFTNTVGSWAEGSAVKELFDAGISMEKLVVGKPISTSSGNGYWAPETLNSLGCRAKSEFGFVGGFMTWMYKNSDRAESLSWADALKVTGRSDILAPKFCHF